MDTEQQKKRRSPDAAQRNPGELSVAAPSPDYVSLHPGYILEKRLRYP